MADAHFRFTIAPASEAEFVERLGRYIAEHLDANRHPDGVAPAVLAQDLVSRLRASLSLFTAEDLERES